MAGTLACSDVVRPAVPGALDDVALAETVAERASLVDAGVVEGVKGTVDVKERDGGAAGIDGFAFSGREIRGLCYAGKIS